MIILSGAARFGKTTFARNNGFATFLDLILSNGFFGSVDDHVVQSSSSVGARANSKIGCDFFKPGIYSLSPEKRPDGDYYLFVPENDSFPGELGKGVTQKFNFSEVDSNHSIHAFLDNSTVRTVIGNGRGNLGLTWDSNKYRSLGMLNPFFYKNRSVFIPVDCTVPGSFNFFDSYVPIAWLINCQKIHDGGSKSYIYRFVGVGFKVTDGANVGITFALDHFFFMGGIRFSGVPYINISEDGPSQAVNYLTPKGDLQESCWGYTTMVEKTQTYEHQQNMLGIKCSENVFFDARWHYNSQSSKSDIFLIDVKAFHWVLKCNRCFFDSIIETIYSGTESALPGGISKSLVFQLISNNRSESIGVYSPLDATGSKDPLASLFTDAHTCGALSLELGSKGYPERGFLTSRNAPRRDQWYKFVEQTKVYGNYLVGLKQSNGLILPKTQRYYDPYDPELRIDINSIQGKVVSGSLDSRIIGYNYEPVNKSRSSRMNHVTLLGS